MNRNTTIVLLVVLGALVLYLVLVQTPRDRAAAEATPTAGAATTYVFAAASTDVRGARVVEAATGRSVAFAQDAQGVWAVSEPQAEPADQAAAAEAAGRFAALFVNNTITTTTDLSGFGVLSPTYTLEVDLADGRRLRAAVGDKTPTGSGYYVLREGESNVVVAAAASIESVIALLDQPPVELTPTPAVTDVTSETPAAGETETDGTPEPAATGAATATP